MSLDDHKYYRNHRADILARRRERYWTDPDYRAYKIAYDRARRQAAKEQG